MTDKTRGYLERACLIHGGKYDYSLVGEITSNKQYVDIVCPIHGAFSQSVSSHINAKQGCPRCSGNYRKTIEEVMVEIGKIHGEKFTYSPFTYKHNKQKIEIFCQEHGSFWTGIKEHLYGGGCPKCAKNLKGNTSSFILKAKKKHGDRYSYDNVDYKYCDEHVSITCPKHGDYLQTPHAHLAGYGCSRCVANSSNKENQWLDGLKIDGLLRQYKVKIGRKRYTVDGYDPKTNTVYEFNGDYFHGNPKFFDYGWTNRVTKDTFGVILERTREKERLIKEAGYNLISIWESDYLESIGVKFTRHELQPTERRSNQIAFMKEWLASDDDYDPTNFCLELLVGNPKVI